MPNFNKTAQAACLLLASFSAGCAVEMGEYDEALLDAREQEVHGGIAVGSSASNDAENIEAVVMLDSFASWTGNNFPSPNIPGGCSGIVLAEDILITSAHCVDRFNSENTNENLFGLKPGETQWLHVRVTARHTNGTTEVWDGVPGGDFEGWYQATIHPSYNHKSGSSYKHDIAILIPQTSTRFRGINPAGIWTANTYDGMSLDIYGWGVSSVSGSGWGTLRKGRDNAKISVNKVKTEYVRATDGKSDKARMCSGDSGGAWVRWRDRWPAVIGLHSSTAKKKGEKCAKKNGKHFSTRLSAKIGWIENMIGRNCHGSEGPDFMACTRPPR